MNRTIIYDILPSEEGITVKSYLKKKGFSGRNLIELKKNEDGLLRNGRPVFVIHRLHGGDRLTVQIREEEVSLKIPPRPIPLNIVYEDEDLMVLDKPANMPIHPSMNHYENTLANGLAWYFSCRQENFVFRCINRLDRDTTGLTIIAKHSTCAGILSGQAARREITREYLALAEGTGLPPEGVIDAPLGRKPGSAIERMVDPVSGERAVTRFRVLQEGMDCTLLSLHLETGRTHQIRVHMQFVGHPLIGDFLYNPDNRQMDRQALHSHRLCFMHPFTGEKLEFTSPLPEDMRRALQADGQSVPEALC